MPRSIQEILDHADELAGRFEDYEPAECDERPVEEYVLERATLDRARSERHLVNAVVAARTKGMWWQRPAELPCDEPYDRASWLHAPGVPYRSVSLSLSA